MGGVPPDGNRFNGLIQFKHECELVDIPTQGSIYTWRKNKTRINNIYEKLDRVLVDNQILQWFPNIFTKNYAFTSSDHCPIAINLSNDSIKKAQPFKCEKNMDEKERL